MFEQESLNWNAFQLVYCIFFTLALLKFIRSWKTPCKKSIKILITNHSTCIPHLKFDTSLGFCWDRPCYSLTIFWHSVCTWYLLCWCCMRLIHKRNKLRMRSDGGKINYNYHHCSSVFLLLLSYSSEIRGEMKYQTMHERLFEVSLLARKAFHSLGWQIVFNLT